MHSGDGTVCCALPLLNMTGVDLDEQVSMRLLVSAAGCPTSLFLVS